MNPCIELSFEDFYCSSCYFNILLEYCNGGIKILPDVEDSKVCSSLNTFTAIWNQIELRIFQQ